MHHYRRYISVVGLLIGVLSWVMPAFAISPSDYGLHEGDLISAANSNDPDIYIINDLGYKRLFLNPIIFSFYGHLGGFVNVKTATPVTRDAFQTSTLFRNCETDAPQVYATEVTGEDTGILHPVQIDGTTAAQQDPEFFRKVFCINTNELQWYPKSSFAYTSVAQIPLYIRQSSSSPTPTMIPSPSATPPPSSGGGGGSVPAPTPTPSTTPPPGPQIVEVIMNDFQFNPGTINVPQGDIIRFINHDTFGHSAVADGGQWSTSVLLQGESYDMDTTILPIGTYRYHCGVHGPGETGTLRVRSL